MVSLLAYAYASAELLISTHWLRWPVQALVIVGIAFVAGRAGRVANLGLRSYGAATLAAMCVVVGVTLRTPALLALGLLGLWGWSRPLQSPIVGFFTLALAAWGILIVLTRTPLGFLWDDAATFVLRGLGQWVPGIGTSTRLDGEVLFFGAGYSVHASVLVPGAALAMPLLFVLAEELTTRRRLLRFAVDVLVILVVKAIVVGVIICLGLQATTVPFASWLASFGGALAVVSRRWIAGASTIVQVESGRSLPAIIAGVVLALAVTDFQAVYSGRLPLSQIGAVCIDEAHGLWETTEVEYKVGQYGRSSVYTYRLLRDWLERETSVRLLKEHLVLDGCNVFFVKTPVEPYTEEEVNAVRSFVADGGGLVAIADHTDLFGSSGVLNDLLSFAGIRVRYDAAIPFSGTDYRFQPSWWNTSRLLKGIPYVDFQTAASLDLTSLRAVPEIISNDLVAEGADYSNDRFFGDLSPSLDDRVSPLTLAASRRYGAGKIVVFADSTIWSNFSFTFPFNRRLLRNLLTMSQTGQPLIVSIVGWFAAALIIGWALRTSCSSRHGATMILGTCAVAVAVLASLQQLVTLDDVDPASGRNICVDMAHSTFSLSTDIKTGRFRDFETYSAFFAWMPRMGLTPQFAEHTCYATPSVPTILLNPQDEFSRYDLRAIESYVRAGGRLLVLDDPMWIARSTTDQILSHFGIALRALVRSSGAFAPGGLPLPDTWLGLPLMALGDGEFLAGERKTALTGSVFTVVGLTPDLVDEDGLVVDGHKEVGQGRVLVFFRSAMFSQYVLGDVWGGVDPGSKAALYEAEERVLTKLKEVEDNAAPQ